MGGMARREGGVEGGKGWKHEGNGIAKAYSREEQAKLCTSKCSIEVDPSCSLERTSQCVGEWLAEGEFLVMCVLPRLAMFASSR